MNNAFSIIAHVAEGKIRDAAADGAFDDLPGFGRPLELEDDSNVPPDLRMAYKILRNSGHIPPEVQTQKDIRKTVDLLDACTDEQRRLRQMRKLDAMIRSLGDSRLGKAILESNPDYYAKILDRVRLEGGMGRGNPGGR